MAAIDITKNNFQSEVLSSDKPVLIDFWAAWCGPCRMLSPIVEELAGELSGKVKVGKVNVDEERELAAQFQIMSIPTLVVIKDGKITASAAGVRPKAAIKMMLED